MNSNPEIFLVAGEPSGDRIGAGLAQALIRKHPNIRLTGLGGPLMRAAGVDLWEDMTHLAVIGLMEVLKHYGQFRKIFNNTRQTIKLRKPKAVILIDFPGFNLRLVKALGDTGIPLIYYVSPQFWAWGERRIWIIKKYIRRVLTILPFEVDFYKNHGIEADYVGHPMIDMFSNASQEVSIGLIQNSQGPVISILPGSRLGEISRLWPILRESANLLRKSFPNSEFLIPCATDDIYERMKELTGAELFLKLVRGQMRECLKVSHFAWVCSGTATLETAYLGVPLLVVYRTSRLTAWFAKRLIRVPFVGLVNLVAGEEVAREFLQEYCRPELIVQETKVILENRDRRSFILEKLKRLRQKLGGPGASDRAAEKIWEVLAS